MSDDATLDEFVESNDTMSEDRRDSELREEGFLTLPQEWDISTVADIAKEGGLVDGDWIESKDMDENGEIQLVQLAHIGEGDFKGKPDRFITKEFAEEENCTILSEGDLLISRMQEPILRSCLLPSFDQDSIMAVDIARLQHKQNWNRHFLKYLFNSRPIWKQGIAWASGTTRKRISRTNMEKLRLPTPPISEQRKIATVLHTVDQAIQKTEEIIDQNKRLRKGLRQDLFTVGINKSGQIRSNNQCQDTYLGKIPKDWELRQVNEVCTEVVDCPHSTPEYTEEGIIVVRTSEIEDGQFNPSGSPKVSEEGYKKRISRLEPQAGDVIFTREAPIGEAFKIPEGMKLCLGQRLMQLRPKEEVLDPDFLVELIYSDMMQKWFERSARGSTSTHINVGDMETLRIPVPSFEEQQRIDSVLGTYREQLEIEQAYLDSFERLKQGLMQDLLSGTVRTTDTNIQVADEIEQYG